MEITLIIVGGVVALTLIAAVSDSFVKAKQAQAAASPLVEDLNKRIAALEAKAAEQDSKILLLEENVSFTSKLLDDRSGSGKGPQ